MRIVLRPAIRLLFQFFTRLTVKGIENIPLQGACLVTSNHIGILDAPLVFSLIHRDDATGLIAKKHQNNALIRWVVNNTGGIWIDLTRTDFQALKAAHSLLKSAGLLGISPEGTRSKKGGLLEPKPGVSYFAAKFDVAIVPMAITGTEFIKEIFLLQRPKIRVIIGEPFRLPALDRKDRAAAVKRNADKILCHIATLLPPEYRGVYADHPYLLELLNR